MPASSRRRPAEQRQPPGGGTEEDDLAGVGARPVGRQGAAVGAEALEEPHQLRALQTGGQETAPAAEIESQVEGGVEVEGATLHPALDLGAQLDIALLH